eukprot:CAMPEP_0181076268 /NCGR_PEP_ID=MMETSP1071-20121207/330_1 /TAXON_ID=35127 /ORGANISM="Thalassiosira sp., Strain NH16" /LENGTH=70 /DNA_ID=CAMNT_0023157441 /DNA_START=201 /DNA_END=413 /DNA_ORIENTATION=-
MKIGPPYENELTPIGGPTTTPAPYHRPLLVVSTRPWVDGIGCRGVQEGRFGPTVDGNGNEPFWGVAHPPM